MIIVVDSGASKADWHVERDQASPLLLQSLGLNPFLASQEDMRNIIEESVCTEVDRKAVKQVFFYGAGCASPSSCALVGDVLKALFTSAEVVVYSDMVGAARAVCGQSAGVVCILGTGSNACVYDGQEVEKRTMSLGYLLGDEGSGAYLGKQLLVDYFYGRLPKHLHDSFGKQYGEDAYALLNKVYQQEAKQAYLASFTRFLHVHKEAVYVQGLVKRAFDSFLQQHVLGLAEARQWPVSFVGSVAFYFEDVLAEALTGAGLRLGKVVGRPIDGLAAFHTLT